MYQPLYTAKYQIKYIGKPIEWNTRKDCINSFGYAANVNLPLWKNAETVLSNMSTSKYFNRPYQMAFHNLCETLSPPKGIGITLSLGLKFCIQSNLPKHDISPSIEHFIHDV
jgi:hypothetical protein